MIIPLCQFSFHSALWQLFIYRLSDPNISFIISSGTMQPDPLSNPPSQWTRGEAFFSFSREDWKGIMEEGRSSFLFLYDFCLFLLGPTVPQWYPHSVDILPLGHAHIMEPLGQHTAPNPTHWPPCWDTLTTQTSHTPRSVPACWV